MGPSPCTGANLRAQKSADRAARVEYLHRPPRRRNGDPANGMVVVDGTTLEGAVKAAPRINFAWNCPGDNKTAIRGGYGLAFDRYQDDFILSLIEQPPLLDTQQATLHDHAGAPRPGRPGVPLTGSVRGVNAFAPFTPPLVHSWSLGVQQELPWRVSRRTSPTSGTRIVTTQVNVDINGVGYGVTNLPAESRPHESDRRGQARRLPAALSGRRQDSGAPVDRHGGLSLDSGLGQPDDAGLSLRFAYTGSVRKSQGTFDPFLAAIGFDDRAAQQHAEWEPSAPLDAPVLIRPAERLQALEHSWCARARRLADQWSHRVRGGTRDNFGATFTGAPSGLTGAINGQGIESDAAL